MFFEFFQRILPVSFLNNTLVNATGVYKAIARQFDDLKAAIEEGQNQLFIDSATYMLPIYEAEFSIQYEDASNIEGRRNNVMAMSRGGLGSTPEALKNVLKSYGYETEILRDYQNYRITVQFIDNRGIPSNINDLKAIVYKMVPGHLEVKWAFIYTQHQELTTFTHGQLQAYTNEYLKAQLPN